MYLNLPEFLLIYPNLPEITLIYLISSLFTWIYLKLHETTGIHLNLPEFILIYMKLPEFTWIHLNKQSISPMYRDPIWSNKLSHPPCHKGNFSLNGGPYKIFWMILSYVSTTFRNMFVFKIFNEGFMVNQHPKNVTRPTFEHQLHLALQQYILSASAFYAKR